MRERLLYLVLLLSAYNVGAQTDNIGSGQALYFNGGTGHVDFGDVYNDLTFPFTISFWVKLDENKNGVTAIFATEEGSFEYRGFWVRITKTNIGLGRGDGLGGNNPQFRRVKQQDVDDLSGRWNHISIAAASESNIAIYLNGIDIGGFFTGTTTNEVFINADDEVRIGKFYSNGETWRMQGGLDEMRLWNYPRTIHQVRQDMCRRLTGNETGLIGYWNFDEFNGSTTYDLSAEDIDGEIVGSIDRDYSGAPIGDASVNSYSGLEGLSLTEGSDKITITDLSPNVGGLHIYKINNPPSQIDISDPEIRSYYYGVFPATTSSEPTSYNLNIEGSCSLAKRQDNSEPSWSRVELENFELENEIRRGEYILISNSEDLILSLEEDISICDAKTYLIEPTFSESSVEYFVWQDGTLSTTYEVSKSGIYWFEIGNQCGSLRDSISVIFSEPIEGIDLGPDIVICEDDELILAPAEDDNITYYLWQDGSTMPFFNLDEPGEYWLEVGNTCGFVRDTVQVTLEKDLHLSLTNDTTICNAETYLIEPTFSESAAEYFTWQDGTSSTTYQASQSGIYWFEIRNQCGSLRDSINVIFSKSIEDLDLGPDVAVCESDELTLSPMEDENIAYYLWQDGSTEPSFNLRGPGVYWLEVGNNCGFVRDTVNLTLKQKSDIFIPNVITPNNDPLNEYFKIDSQITDASLMVFNRWGKEVFTDQNYKNNWNGKGVTFGVYFFKIKDKCTGQEFKGPLTIMK